MPPTHNIHKDLLRITHSLHKSEEDHYHTFTSSAWILSKSQQESLMGPVPGCFLTAKKSVRIFFHRSPHGQKDLLQMSRRCLTDIMHSNVLQTWPNFNLQKNHSVVMSGSVTQTKSCYFLQHELAHESTLDSHMHLHWHMSQHSLEPMYQC